MEFQSNTELLEAVEKLQVSFLSTGNEKAGELLLEGISSLNGLTDGWALLLKSINTAKGNYGTTFSQQQSSELNIIQNAVHKVVHRA